MQEVNVSTEPLTHTQTGRGPIRIPGEVSASGLHTCSHVSGLGTCMRSAGLVLVGHLCLGIGCHVTPDVGEAHVLASQQWTADQVPCPDASPAWGFSLVFKRDSTVHRVESTKPRNVVSGVAPSHRHSPGPWVPGWGWVSLERVWLSTGREHLWGSELRWGPWHPCWEDGHASLPWPVAPRIPCCLHPLLCSQSFGMMERTSDRQKYLGLVRSNFTAQNPSVLTGFTFYPQWASDEFLEADHWVRVDSSLVGGQSSCGRSALDQGWGSDPTCATLVGQWQGWEAEGMAPTPLCAWQVLADPTRHRWTFCSPDTLVSTAFPPKKGKCQGQCLCWVSRALLGPRWGWGKVLLSTSALLAD